MADRDREPLDLGEGWTRRWVTRWKAGKSVVSRPVREMAGVCLPECRPVRRFTWSTGQRHRPGLAMVTSTGRLHGFESIAEQRLLLTLDFLGVTELLGQPMTLKFTTTGGGTAEHVPDFLAVTRSGAMLLDVRPAERIGDRDRVKFAAAAGGPLPFGDLVRRTSYPVIGRAHAIHLLWRRQLGTDLARPLGDESVIWPAARGAGR